MSLTEGCFIRHKAIKTDNLISNKNGLILLYLPVGQITKTKQSDSCLIMIRIRSGYYVYISGLGPDNHI